MAVELAEVEKSRRVLLVEGPDDHQVFRHLTGRHGLPEQFTVVPCGGIEAAYESLETRLLAENEDCLGIAIDVDGGDLTDATQRRWTRVQAILRASGYTNIPARPHSEGTIIREAGKPVVGIWLMPDNELPGMLEDFVGLLVPEEEKPRKLWMRATEAVQAIPADERLFGPTDVTKAMIHTWLAWQEEPGSPMGLAIRKGFLNPHAPNAVKLIAWLRSLFDLGTA